MRSYIFELNENEKLFLHNIKDIEVAYNRYKLVSDIFQNHEDYFAISSLENLLFLCEDYIKYIFHIKKRITQLGEKYGFDSVLFNESAIRLGNERILRHDDVIYELGAFNSFFNSQYKSVLKEDFPIGGIYTKDLALFHKREEITLWSYEFIVGYQLNKI